MPYPEWTEEQKVQRARYALSRQIEVSPNLLTFEGLPADWKVRIEHQQAENDRLHTALDGMRNCYVSERRAHTMAREQALEEAARIARNFCMHWGDEKQYPSVTGLEIAEEIQRRADGSAH